MKNGDISLYDAEYTGVNLHGCKFSRVEAWTPTPDDSVRYESLTHHIRKFPFGAIGDEGNTRNRLRPPESLRSLLSFLILPRNIPIKIEQSEINQKSQR